MTGFARFVSLLWALAAAGLAWHCAHLAQQITYVTLADGRQKERRLPLFFRLLLPLTPNLTRFFLKPVFARTRERLSEKLLAAGFRGLLLPEEFLALRALFPLLLGAVWIVFIHVTLGLNPNPLVRSLAPPLFLLGPLWLFAYPALWLNATLRRRHNSIRKSLPFTLDLLTLSVEAGMDFMSALQRAVTTGEVDALSEELITVVREIQLGKTRREALRELGKRVGLPELRAVVNALVQADELGVSIGSILRIQADQIRQRRFENAERLANEAPVKMLFPLLLFIFPSVFLVLLGPIIYRLLQQGF